ncbi:hypothetical protein DMENIID0001_072720 [Sergentomyia squamirostris]
MATAAKKTKPTLEDYIFDMETRPPDAGKPEGDLWAQLQQKEADLVLAAELGKALLEKNEELAKQQEKIIEEYSTKLECSRGQPWLSQSYGSKTHSLPSQSHRQTLAANNKIFQN